MICLSIALALLASCANHPFSSTTGGKGSVLVTIGRVGISNAKAARTIVPDLVANVDSYTITLTSHDGLMAKTASATTASPTCTFSDVESGTWDVSALAFRLEQAGSVVDSIADTILTTDADLSYVIATYSKSGYLCKTAAPL
jgi:hypothetical protein